MFVIILDMQRTPNRHTRTNPRPHSQQHNQESIDLRHNRPVAGYVENGRWHLDLDAVRTPRSPNYTGRRWMTGLIVGGLALGAGVIGHSKSTHDSEHGRAPVIGAAAVVEPNDTLWSIVSRYHEGDPRGAIDEVTALRGGDAIVRPGDVVDIPADIINIQQNPKHDQNDS